MTVTEACALHVELVRELSAVRKESESWRLVALASIDYASELWRELEMTSRSSYTWRRSVQDERDVWADQADLREREAA
jgi:hypothetical protein